MKRLYYRRVGGVALVLLLMVTMVAGGFARDGGYEPQIGQSGKDVVWVPTPQNLVDTMLDMAEVTAADYVIDLGSGDGRTVITAAKRGARAMGIEYNPDMVTLAERNAAQAGVADKTMFVKADLFESDFSKATVITMFLLPRINLELRPKILNMKPGTRVVSNSFDMGDWKADRTENLTDNCTGWCTAYLWIVPARVEGKWKMAGSEINFKQEFQNLTGTFTSSGKTVELTGSLDGDKINFIADGVKYAGKVSGNAISGTKSSGGSWKANR